MTQRGLLLLLATSACAVAANLMLRGSFLRSGHFMLVPGRLPAEILGLCRRPMFLGGMALYGAAAVLWFRVLSTQDLSLSYPLMVSLTFVMVTGGASFFFGEPVTGRKVLGLSVILAGIALAAWPKRPVREQGNVLRLPGKYRVTETVVATRAAQRQATEKSASDKSWRENQPQRPGGQLSPTPGALGHE